MKLTIKKSKEDRWLDRFWRFICWVVYPVLVWSGIISILVFCMMSCATQMKQHEHEHQTHVVVADTLSQHAQHDGHSQQTAADLDSIVTASVWAAMAEFAAQEHSKEITHETVTTWIDSLGREVRQEQRTTERELSKLEQQRLQQTEQRWQNQLHQSLSQMDSTWSDRFDRMETTMRDSLNAVKDKISQTSATPALTWWQKLWQQWKGFLAGILVCAVLFLTRKIWMAWTPISK